jgi:hypothetical protein
VCRDNPHRHDIVELLNSRLHERGVGIEAASPPSREDTTIAAKGAGNKPPEQITTSKPPEVNKRTRMPRPPRGKQVSAADGADKNMGRVNLREDKREKRADEPTTAVGEAVVAAHTEQHAEATTRAARGANPPKA